MGGVTSSYILAKLAATGTTAATKAIIPGFLNSVPDAAALAGVEPVEGSIVDDPAYGWGDQIRDYDNRHHGRAMHPHQARESRRLHQSHPAQPYQRSGPGQVQ